MKRMVLTSYPFSLSVSPSNFFAACGTFMTWSCTASHFFVGSFGSTPHFYGRSFGVWRHFYGRTFITSEQARGPFFVFYVAIYAKTRRKHERNTKFCVFFVCRRRKSSGKNSPLIGVKNQWSKLDH